MSDILTIKKEKMCDNLHSFAKSCSEILVDLNERIVFAESCTGGMIASSMAGVPGISNYLCGSFVTYRADSKRKWLGVKKSTISSFTTESFETAQEMAIGALEKTPEADWSLSIVGHFGPDAPEEKDGIIWVCVARRSRKGKIKIKMVAESKLAPNGRLQRQKNAAETAFTFLSRTLLVKSQKESVRKQSA